MAQPWFQLVGPEHNVQLFGVKLLGFDAHNLHKLVFSAVFLAIMWLLRTVLRAIAKATRTSGESKQAAFWTGQGISIVTFGLGLLGLISIWFDNPARLATGVAMIGAGLAFALQKVITSFAGYVIILRGKTFSVGDRIAMGGVRGDVVNLSFFQTTIMEMGVPPTTDADKGIWVQSRQFSGRIVTVANSKIFEDPVFNYTHEFPYIWEEMHLPISYKDDRNRAEQILLEAAARETVKIEEIAEPSLKQLEDRFLIKLGDIKPHVYWRLTDNWVELTVRFLSKSHDVRSLKDRMSRYIIAEMDKAGIGIASGTYEIVGMPTLRVELDQDRTPRA